MKYCEHCEILGEETCPKCKRPLREPKENDPVLLCEVGFIKASMVEALLNEEKIPFIKRGRMGAGLAMKVGNMLETYRISVPFGAYDFSKRLLEAYEQAEDAE